uniref:Uncharacterized protein n=1 Tax=viral metagenome TaxID=1070528 RepID=A0A6C0JBE9_9ZZZZ
MCFKSKYEDKFTPIIRNIDLEENKRKILLVRFLEEVIYYDKKAIYTEFFFYFFSLIITIGSIILPALLSIQNINFSEDEDTDARYKDRVYWFSWAISLIITICNGLIQLFSLNKQFISYIGVREKLVSEGWKYLELCEDYYGGNHKDNFIKFCEEIENIKKNQTDREVGFQKKNNNANNANANNANNANNVNNYSNEENV